jgi:hypothetical protein
MRSVPEKLLHVFRETQVCTAAIYKWLVVYRLHLADLVQRGISEKVPMCIQFVSTFIAGFVLAFVRNWRLALAISSVLPCIMITGALMGKFMVRYSQYVLLFHSEPIDHDVNV